MMKKFTVIYLFFLVFQTFLFAQENIPAGTVSSTNVEKKTVLLTFKTIPTKEERRVLASKGVSLEGFAFGTSYYATVPVDYNKHKGGNIQYSQQGKNVNVIIEETSYKIKLDEALKTKTIPEYAQVSEGVAKVVVGLFPSVNFKDVEVFLKTKKLKNTKIIKPLLTLYCDLPLSLLEELAKQTWVKRIECIAPAPEFNNVEGRTMTRSNLLSYSGVSGRNLQGLGINVGIWDGNLENHPDLDNRLTTREFRYGETHGQHVSGTMAGAGILDPRGRGVAPEVKVFAWNFKYGVTAEEMLHSVINDGIVITQNSYGVSAKNYCKSVRTYDIGAAQSDLLANVFPFLTHVYSGGNDQQTCTGKSQYGSVMQRFKNAILVAAVDASENMSNFSSWGPTDDGRLVPHISTMGVEVYSTMYNNEYAGGYIWSGTSMAAPAISGLAALLYERYEQLHENQKPLSSLIKGVLLNTAKEKGNKGPDYQYGFGIAHGEEAISLLEKNQYFIGKVAHDEIRKHTIEVPEDAIELKVMLVWTDKEGTAGSKALINDLDLTLNNGGTKYLPWVLNPSRPERLAERRVDDLNNQEQITIENPVSGTCEITVKGTKLPEDAQEYALVYHFVKKKLHLDFPNGGEKFQPKDEIVARWNSEGYNGTTTVELSLDNGQTFTTIEKGIPSDIKTCKVPIPDGVITDKALLRVIQDGTMDVSDTPFIILQAPKNLKLISQSCNSSGWRLIWDSVEGAEKYEVLKADGEGAFNSLGEVTENLFEVTQLTPGRDIFTVRAITASGMKSERAYAVLANDSKTLTISSATLPFSEEFAEVPSPYISVETADSVFSTYTHLRASDTNIGARGHLLVFKGKSENKHVNSDSFETGKDYIANAKICDIDATNISGDLWMRFLALVNSPKKQAKLRVLVDGEPRENSFKETDIIENTKGKVIKYYNLSDKAGSHFSLDFQSLLPTKADTVQFTLIQIFEDKKDAMLLSLNVPKSAETLSDSEPISIRLKNNSGKELNGITVKYTVNGGKLVTEEITRPIEPFQAINYTFSKNANLSESDKVYRIEAWVELEGDEKPQNDKLVRNVANYGNYYRLPKQVSFFPENKEVGEEGLRFTDDGARILNYSNSFAGAIIFVPKTADKKVKISFNELELAEGDKLTIYDGPYSTSSVLAVLDKNTKLPMEFTSSHYKGNLLVDFKSDKRNNAAGWFADVTETDKDGTGEYNNNVLTLGQINNKHGNFPTMPTPPISILVKNNTTKPINGVKVQYRVNGGKWSVEEKIDSLKAKESLTYKFKELYDYTEQAKSYQIEARILTEDAYMDDNSMSAVLVNDVYCVAESNSSRYKDFIFFTKVTAADVVHETSKLKQGGIYPQYFRDINLPAYRDIATNNIEVTVNKGYDTGNIGLWIDWNNNGVFDAVGETVTPVSTKAGQTSYTLNYSIPQDIVAGKYNARLRVQTGGDLSDVCKSDSYSENGEIEDYVIELFENYPYSQDLAIVATALENGHNLTNAEPVAVTVRNVGSKNIDTFDLSYIIDGGAEVKETVTHTILPGADYTYTFTTKADVSAIGYHSVRIVGMLEGDINQDNNVLEKNFLNEVPVDNGFFALNFDGVDDIVDFGTLNDTRLTTCTYEAWINPRTAGFAGNVGFGRVVEGKGVVIFLTGTHKVYKENSLVISYAKGRFNTPANVIKYNEWQHIATSIDDATKTVKVYVNGEEIALNQLDPISDTIDDNTKTKLYVGDRPSKGRAFNGMIDEFRVWNKMLTKEEVRNGMYTHKEGAKDLLAEFHFDEGYFNGRVVSGEYSGVIQNAELSNTENSIWIEPLKLMSYLKFKEQLIDWVVEGTHYTTEVTQDTDLSALVGEFQTTWPNTVVQVNGKNQVSEVTSNDFSGSVSTPIKYSASATVFGKQLTQDLNVTIKKEKSVACDLLTLELGQPVAHNIDNITSNMIVNVAKTLDVTAVPTIFTISADATAYVGDEKLQSGDILNYSKPVVIRVLAANGRTEKYYTISIQKAQEIKWDGELTNKVYGDEPFVLGAVSTSGRELSYKSSNPDVVRISLDKAVIVGVGTVEITAYQEGDNTVQGATPITKTLTVVKRDLTIVADDKSIEYTDEIPALTMSFDGFVRNDTKESLDELPRISTEAEKGSPAGEYPITLTGGVDSNYNYLLKNGVLSIKEVVTYALTFRVSFEGVAEEGVRISIAGTTLETDAQGVATVNLKAGTYPYQIEKDGREPVSGEIQLKDAAVELPIELIKELPIYTITYTTDANGDIEGESVQKIKAGKDGTLVTAIPRTGYKFEKWSDGSLSPTHIATNVLSDATYTAQFAKRSYTLVYDAGVGGTISGTTSQTVVYGEDGTTIQLIPKEGYTFKKWSDGIKDNPRKDTNISENILVTAIYAKVYELPYKQTFDSSNLPEDWEIVDNAGSGCTWNFKAKGGYYTGPKIDGSDANHAYMDAYKCSRIDKKNADLISPIFDFTTLSSVVLKFKHNYKKGFSNKESATVAYSIDGGDWVEIIKLDENTKDTETIEKELKELAGKSNVRFKWNLTEAFYYWIVDDIELTGSVAADEYSIVYRSGENGTLENANAGGTVTATIKHGEAGPEVKAVGNPGFKFYKWSDGVTDNPRKDIVTSEIDVTAIFGSDCASVDVFPYSENFDARTSTPDCWETPKNSEGNQWNITTNNTMGTIGNTMFFDASSIGVDAPKQDAHLLSPTFDFSNVKQVQIMFKMFFVKIKGDGKAIIEYTLDNGQNWTFIDSWEKSSNTLILYKKNIPSLVGRKNVRFRWTYQGAFDMGMNIDEFEVRTTPAYFVSYETTGEYDANNNWVSKGFIKGRYSQTVEEGKDAEAVEAVANSGFEFVKWSDGITDNPRTDKDVRADIVVIAEFRSTAVTEYTLVYTAGANGTLSGTVSQTVQVGADGTAVEAIPDTGYKFVKWSDGVTDNPRIDKGIRTNIYVAAEFEKIAVTEYTLVYTAGANGTLSGTVSQTVQAGADGTAVEAIPDTGYKFVKWSDGVTDNPRTDKRVKADISVVAEFELIPPTTYTLKYTVGANGQVAGKTTQTVEEGADGEAVEALADSGYKFVRWSDGVTDNPRIDKNVKANLEVTAEFVKEAEKFTLIYKTNGFGELEGETMQQITKGGTATLVKAIPATGYEFVRWSDGSTENPRMDIDVQKDLTVVAEFYLPNVPKFVLSYSGGGFHGTVEGYNPQIVPEGESGVAVEAVPYKGYEFVRWSDGSRDNPRIDKNVRRNIYVSPIFVKLVIREYNLIYTAGIHGTVTGETYQSVKTGESGTAVEAIPTHGYEFVRWSDGKTDNPRIDKNVKRDIYAKAKFRKVQVPQHTLVYRTNGYGRLVGQTFQRVDQGQSGVEVRAIPFRGYKFVKWSDGSRDNPRVDKNVMTDIRVIAEFERVTPKYTLIYIAGDNGKIEGTESQEVVEGEDGTEIKAVADKGYKFVEWSDGVTDNPRIEKQVQNNIVVTALFDKEYDEYTLVYTSGRHGTVSGTTEQTVKTGEDGTAVEAVADSGYKFVKWSDGVTDNPRTDLKVSRDVYVRAIFEWIPVKEYVLTYSTDGRGKIHGRTFQRIAEGQNGSSVEAVAFKGYKFAKWSDGVTTNPRIDSLVKADIDVVAEFTELPRDTYTLVYTSGRHGTVSGTTEQTVKRGKDGTAVEAVADSGYKFVEWSDGVTDNPRTDLKVSRDVYVRAIFEWIPLKEYVLTYSTDGRGEIHGRTFQRIAEGQNGSSVEAVAFKGYKFAKWSDGVTTNPRIDSLVKADIDVVAEFTELPRDTYTLVYTSGRHGTVSGTTEQTVKTGKDGTAVEAVADSGYKFVKWSDGVTDNPRTDLKVSGDVYVRAIFEWIPVKEYVLTYSTDGRGEIHGRTFQRIAEGQNGSSVEAVAFKGYKFAKWSDGVTTNPRIDSLVKSDIDVVAEFTELPRDTYTLVYTSGRHGTVSGTTEQTVKTGEDGTAVEAVADSGYKFVEWSDGVTDNPRTDLKVSRDVYVRAIFEKVFVEKFRVVYIPDYNGEIKGEDRQYIEKGADATPVEAVPNTGYEFAGWSDGSTDNPRTDKAIARDMVLVANFKKKPEAIKYILYYIAGSGGQIHGRRSQKVDEGADGTAVQAIPYSGYEFKQWSDGNTQNPRVDTAVSSDIIVVAEFDRIVALTHQLNYRTDGKGRIKGRRVQEVEDGSDGMEVKAVPFRGYEFVRWSDGVTDNPRIDKDVKSDIDVVAEFKFKVIPPKAKNDSFVIEQGEDAYILDVLNNDRNISNAILTLTQPKHGVVEVLDDNTVSYKPEADYTGEDEFSYTVCVDGECAEATVVISIQANKVKAIEKQPKVVQPSGMLSPNGDGINDAWEIPSLKERVANKRGNYLKVFSAKGKLVYEKKNYMFDEERFTGVAQNGTKLKAGVYFYIIEIDGEKTKKGLFYIMK